jgi:hypothetical protein
VAIDLIMSYENLNFNNVCFTLGVITKTDGGFMGSDPYFSLDTDVHFKCSPKMSDHVKSKFIPTAIPVKVIFYLPVSGEPHALRIEPVDEKVLNEYIISCRSIKRQC